MLTESCACRYSVLEESHLIRFMFQDEMIPGVSKDQEALLISLRRPIICVQPAAFDKGTILLDELTRGLIFWITFDYD